MAGTKKRSRDEQSDIESELDTAKPTKSTKKSKTATAGLDSGKDSEGNSYWDLSGKRRVTLSEFKKTRYISIREHWTDASGDVKPGKKGISLPVDQFNALLKAIPAIREQLIAEGLDVVEVPSSTSATASSHVSERPVSKEKKKKEKKANIEVTSDEDEEDEAED